MALIKCKECRERVSNKATTCPKCGAPTKKKSSPLAVGCLTTIIIIGVFSWLSGSFDSSKSSFYPTSSKSHTSPSKKPVKSEPVLELQSWSWHTEYDYVIAEGTVKNISNQNLKNVTVVIQLKDSNGRYITSDEAVIKYNPILPGQISPFKVMPRHNPEMSKASIDFKYLLGGTLPWREVE